MLATHCSARWGGNLRSDPGWGWIDHRLAWSPHYPEKWKHLYKEGVTYVIQPRSNSYGTVVRLVTRFEIWKCTTSVTTNLKTWWFYADFNLNTNLLNCKITNHWHSIVISHFRVNCTVALRNNWLMEETTFHQDRLYWKGQKQAVHKQTKLYTYAEFFSLINHQWDILEALSVTGRSQSTNHLTLIGYMHI